MSIFSGHLMEWFILFALLAVALYTLKVIGAEKSTFKQESYTVRFGKLGLMVPNWWSIVGQSDESLRFERTDTRYDWYALFTHLREHGGKPLEKLLEEKLDLEEIEFDLDVSVETDSRVLFRDPTVQAHFQEVVRVEGKASQKGVERLHYDIYLMRGLDEAGYFIFESKSSVLNGLVEGPYFEESLSELSLVPEA